MSSSPDDLIRLFKDRFEAVSGEYIGCTGVGDAMRRLSGLFINEDWDRAAAATDAPVWARNALKGVAMLFPVAEAPESRSDMVELLASMNAGITRAEGLIADTGTIAIASRSRGDRLTSLLPPVHIAIIFGTPIYETLAEYLEEADRSLTHQFITGPSRTADIEKELVLGVHGPLRVIVFGPEI
jgi:L-lactate dehydrogenase complex protein LldG